MSPDSLLESLDKALRARAAVFPARGPEYDSLIGLLGQLQASLEEEASEARPLPEPLQAPLSASFSGSLHLCGAMKSGTTLLSQLLDGHPQLFVMPGDSYPLRFDAPKNPEESGRIFSHWLQRLINPTGREPFWFLPRQWPALVEFLRALRQGLGNGPTFWAVAAAAQQSRVHAGVEAATPRMLVEKTPENELHVDALLKCDPSARFLQIVRHPLANLAALARISEVRGWDCGPLGHARRIGLLHKRAFTNQETLGTERCMTLRYEDLTARPDSIMRQVAEWLGIPWHECLLNPTTGGVGAVSNSAYRQDIVVGRVLDKSNPSSAAAGFDAPRRALIRLAGGAAHRKFGYRLRPRNGVWIDEIK